VLKLASYLKPFVPAMLMVIVLLFAQTISELLLPNLMGDIVNVGIQQGGIEEASPRVLTEDGMRLFKLMMDPQGQALLDECYSLVDGNGVDAKGHAYADTWPGVKDTQIYVQNDDLSDAQSNELSNAFGTATWTLLYLMQDLQVSAEPPTQRLVSLETDQESESELPLESEDISTQTPGVNRIDMATAYSLLPVFESMDPETIDQARAAALELSPEMRAQSARMLISAVYEDLNTDLTSMEMSYIARIGLIMLTVAVFTGAATIFINYLTTRIGTGVSRTLRTVVFSKVASFSHTEFDRFSTASLITRSTNDVMMMQRLVSMGLRTVFHAPVMGIGAAIMAVNKSASMSWIIVLAVILTLGGVIIQIGIVMPSFRRVQTLTDRLNLVAREKLNGLMVIRAFNRDDVEIERFDDANNTLTKTHIFIGRVMAIMGPFMTITMNAVSIIIIWVGGHQVAASQMQVGDMMAYMQYIAQVMMSFMQLSMMFNMIPRAQVSAVRIMEVLETEPAISDPTNPESIDESKRGMIEFKDVSFKYENADEYALENINFTAYPGQTIAFIGPTGSGKSSILNLIPRFYDTDLGSVQVGGVDVRNLTQEELRRHIGYVPQRSILMSGTIASNIAYGVAEDALSYDDYIDVASVAQAIDFIADREEGFYTPVSQSGANVSGGQRQRLSIARALAVNPDIYLFDDSFSALDFTTDAALRKALREHTSNSTLLIVSQRIGTIMDADVIHVIEEGRIVDSGSHEELLVSSPTYYEIASTQLAEVAQSASLVSLTEGGES